MSTQFALDLRLARKQAGYSQYDVAHLLDGSQSLVSELEHGRCRPSLDQIIDLSLIYGRSFEAFFGTVMAERQEHLTTRLATLPAPRRRLDSAFNRPRSLQHLARRLKQDHGSA